MDDNKETNSTAHESVLLIVYRYYLECKKRSRLLFVLLLLCVGGGLLKYYFFTNTAYSATETFTINEANGGNMSGLMSLASQFGIDAGRGNDISTDKVSELLHANVILTQALFQYPAERTNYINRVIDSCGIQRGIAKKFKLQSRFAFVHTNQDSMSMLESAVLSYICVQLNYMIDVKVTKSGIMQCTVKSGNQWVSKTFCERLVSNVGAFYIARKTQRSKAVFELVQNRVDSIQRLLVMKEEQLADNTDKNRISTRSVGTLDQRKAQRETVLLNLLYSEAIKNLELVKFNMENETPVFQVIDRPFYPLEKVSTKLTVILVVAILIAIVLFNLIVYLSILKTTFKESLQNHLTN